MKCCNANRRQLLVVSWAYQATCVYCEIFMGWGCFQCINALNWLHALGSMIHKVLTSWGFYLGLLNIPHFWQYTIQSQSPSNTNTTSENWICHWSDLKRWWLKLLLCHHVVSNTKTCTMRLPIVNQTTLPNNSNCTWLIVWSWSRMFFFDDLYHSILRKVVFGICCV